VFEQYLDQFQGVIICVSHDRYFLDRTCDKLFAFEDGVLNLVILSYSDYLEQTLATVSATPEIESQKNQRIEKVERVKIKKEKLTFKEITALEDLPKEIDKLSETLELLEPQFAKSATDFAKLTELTEKKEHLELELLEKMEQYEALLEKEAALNAFDESRELG
jgi:ATP-binding cassette subfamily F protein uup